MCCPADQRVLLGLSKSGAGFAHNDQVTLESPNANLAQQPSNTPKQKAFFTDCLTKPQNAG